MVDVTQSNDVPATAETGYNNEAYQWILHQELNRLKARLMNLAETTATTENQSVAMKGLIKDFTNQAYYACLGEMEHYLKYFKVLDEMKDGNKPFLEAESLTDIFSN